MKREMRFSIAAASAGGSGDNCWLSRKQMPDWLSGRRFGTVVVVVHALEVDVNRRTLAVPPTARQAPQAHLSLVWTEGHPYSCALRAASCTHGRSAIWAAQSASLNSSGPAQRTCSQAFRSSASSSISRSTAEPTQLTSDAFKTALSHPEAHCRFHHAGHMEQNVDLTSRASAAKCSGRRAGGILSYQRQ